MGNGIFNNKKDLRLQWCDFVIAYGLLAVYRSEHHKNIVYTREIATVPDSPARGHQSWRNGGRNSKIAVICHGGQRSTSWECWLASAERALYHVLY